MTEIDKLYLKALDAAKKEQARSKAENIRRYGSEKEARKISPVYRDLPAQKVLRLAKVDDEWFSIYRKPLVDPKAWKSQYFFFGIGFGYDITRIIVKANSLDQAFEYAAEKLPKLFFTKIITSRQYRKLEENPGDIWENDPENYHFIEDLGKWGLPEQDIRIAKPVTEYVPTAVQSEAFSHTAILPDGRQVEYH